MNKYKTKTKKQKKQKGKKRRRRGEKTLIRERKKVSKRVPKIRTTKISLSSSKSMQCSKFKLDVESAEACN